MQEISVTDAGVRLPQKPGKTAASALLANMILALLFFLSFGALDFAGVVEASNTPYPAGGGSNDNRREESKSCSWLEYRLPEWVKPNGYTLELDVQMEKPYSVVGTAEIGLTVAKPTKCVVLHAAQMTVRSVVLKETGERGNLTERPFQQIMVRFGSNLPKSRATLVFEFNYTLNSGMVGFYKSFYQDGEGESHPFASTQFQPADARLALPCFDEPAMKAPLTLTLVAPSNLTCLANMPERSVDTLANGKSRHTFETSPPMSVYLFAWVVGEMVGIGKDVETMNGTKRVSVWGTPQRAHELKYALECASKIVPHFENLLNVPYTLPKLDLIGIPNFKHGAMENWGLSTFREVYLLLSDMESSSEDRVNVASVTAHEIVHMWFGDLVTLSWWGDTWLHEGFADYLSYYGAEKARPLGRDFQRFFLEENLVAFSSDGGETSHPLSVPKEETVVNGTLLRYFDNISYRKGASVLRMLHTYLNRSEPAYSAVARKILETEASVNVNDRFFAGLESYLKQHEFGNTDTADLLQALSAITRLPVTDMMHKWSYDSGYPVVHVDLDGDRVTVRQRPFAEVNCTRGDEWWIPIQYTTKENPSPRWDVLDTCGPSALTRLANKHDFPIVDKDRLGFYRVLYSRKLMKRLLKSIPGDDSPIGGVDLAGLLIDAYQLPGAFGGIENFLELTRALGGRTESMFAPWDVALRVLLDMRGTLRLKYTECANKLSKYVVAEVTSNMVGEIIPRKTSASTTEPKDYDYQMMEGVVLYHAGVFGDKRVINAALDAVRSNATIDPDLRKAYYSMAVAHGDSTMYDKIKAMFLKATQVHEKERLMLALGAALDPELLNRTLNLAISDDLKSQDTVYLIEEAASQSTRSAELALEFIEENFEAILDKLGGKSGGEDVSTLLAAVGSNFATEKKSQEIEDLFALHADVLVETPYLDLARQAILVNEWWLEKRAKRICRWLKRKGTPRSANDDSSDLEAAFAGLRTGASKIPWRRV